MSVFLQAKKQNPPLEIGIIMTKTAARRSGSRTTQRTASSRHAFEGPGRALQAGDGESAKIGLPLTDTISSGP